MAPDCGHLVIVSFDQRNHAYFIEQSDYDDFIDWVAIQWGRADNFQRDDENSLDYLERIGVTISIRDWL